MSFRPSIRRHTLSLALCGFLVGCGYVDYDKAPVGKFTGTLFVMWIGEGNDTGDGRFVYVPDRNDPLRFVRGGAPAGVAEIEPEMMYTDGGSIPKQAQLFKGFSPWGYAPAYMVHDWIYVARHCITDGQANAREQAISGMSFQDSADLTAEMVKTLIHSQQVSQNDVAPRVISGTVSGPASYQRWAVRGACAADRVSKEHRARAEAALFAPSPALSQEPVASASVEQGLVPSASREPDPAPSVSVDGDVRLITVLRF